MLKKTIDTLVSKRELLGRSYRIFNITDTVVFIQCLKWCVSNDTDVIGILGSEITNSHAASLKSMSKCHTFPINLTILDPQDPPMPLLEHVLHDKHWFIGTIIDTQHVTINGIHIRIEELPTLLLSDPVCMWYGYRSGDVVGCADIRPGSTLIRVVKHDTRIL
jgi:DNA-directed RNA polymerase subunit H (RpoH/RPB5)